MKALNAIENRLIDSLTPRQVRYLHPVAPAKATGTLAELLKISGESVSDGRMRVPKT